VVGFTKLSYKDLRKYFQPPNGLGLTSFFPYLDASKDFKRSVLRYLAIYDNSRLAESKYKQLLVSALVQNKQVEVVLKPVSIAVDVAIKASIDILPPSYKTLGCSPVTTAFEQLCWIGVYYQQTRIDDVLDQVDSWVTEIQECKRDCNERQFSLSVAEQAFEARRADHWGAVAKHKAKTINFSKTTQRFIETLEVENADKEEEIPEKAPPQKRRRDV